MDEHSVIKTIIYVGLGQMFVFVFACGALYQKLMTINGDVRYTRRWRHWAGNAIITLAGKTETPMDELGDFPQSE